MVKPGYKQTEVGVIPDEWDVCPLGSIAHFHDSRRIPIKESDRIKMQGDYPYYGASGIIDYVNDYIFDGNYILLGEDGANIIDRSSRLAFVVSGKCWINNHAHVIEPHKNMDIHFLSEYLESISYDEYNTGTAQPKLNREKCNAIPVPIPPLPEQVCIANYLRECDHLTATIKKEISKKKAIKQGAMQELLTGKKRLPGFSGEWSNFNLMKHSKIKARIGWQGLKKSEYLDSGHALLVTGTDFANGKVQWDSCHYVTRDRYEQDRNIQIQNNDILITKDGSLGKAALVQGLSKPATLNSGIFVIRPLQNAYDPVFVYHILSSFVFKDFLDKLSAGSTIIHLYQKDVGKFEFLLPPTIEEQKAIAAVLSEMDADIAALEEKLAKYRQVKQGMMQQLLTGKIRLV